MAGSHAPPSLPMSGVKRPFAVAFGAGPHAARSTASRTMEPQHRSPSGASLHQQRQQQRHQPQQHPQQQQQQPSQRQTNRPKAPVGFFAQLAHSTGRRLEFLAALPEAIPLRQASDPAAPLAPSIWQCIVYRQASRLITVMHHDQRVSTSVIGDSIDGVVERSCRGLVSRQAAWLPRLLASDASAQKPANCHFLEACSILERGFEIEVICSASCFRDAQYQYCLVVIFILGPEVNMAQFPFASTEERCCC